MFGMLCFVSGVLLLLVCVIFSFCCYVGRLNSVLMLLLFVLLFDVLLFYVILL